MSFKLTKTDLTQRNALARILREKHDALTEAVEAYNEAVRAEREKLGEAIEAYNEALTDVRGFVEDMASQAESDFDDKSESWQEGDKGQAVQEWINELQSYAPDDFEVEESDELEGPDETAIDDFENLPSEPS